MFCRRTVGATALGLALAVGATVPAAAQPGYPPGGEDHVVVLETNIVAGESVTIRLQNFAAGTTVTVRITIPGRRPPAVAPAGDTIVGGSSGAFAAQPAAFVAQGGGETCETWDTCTYSVGADGVTTFEFVPTQAGRHLITATGVDDSGQPITARQWVNVRAAAAGVGAGDQAGDEDEGLAGTGVELSTLLPVAGALAVGGTVLIGVAAARRRRESQAEAPEQVSVG